MKSCEDVLYDLARDIVLNRRLMEIDDDDGGGVALP